MRIGRRLLLHFLGLIAAGTCLLSLPQSLNPGKTLETVDAFFVATSAVCVTGLTPVDVGDILSPFGQAVLLLLFQTGGLSIAAFGLFFIFLARRKLDLFQRKVILTTFAHTGWSDFRPLVLTIAGATVLLELIGAAILYFPFAQHLPPGTALWHAVFHSVSAFCNAGFSLNGESLIAYQANATVTLTVGALLILGGLGFLILSEVFFRFKAGTRLSLHSLLTLKVTGILIVLGMAAHLLLEWNGVLAGKPLGIKLLMALFGSITPRTCGFNTFDYAFASPVMLVLVIVLMFIGGSPGSTAGGIKTTTAGVIWLHLLSHVRGRDQVQTGRRAIPFSVVDQAVSVFFFSLFCLGAGFILLMTLEDGKIAPLDLLFETVSAYGTVGLSTGATPLLGTVGKLILAVLMYVGRLGPMTIVAALAAPAARTMVTFPEEKVIVG